MQNLIEQVRKCAEAQKKADLSAGKAAHDLTEADAAALDKYWEELVKLDFPALLAELQRKDAALELCAQAKQDILGWVRLAKAQREAKLPQCKPHAHGIRLSLELVDRITAMFESLAALQPKDKPCQTV